MPNTSDLVAAGKVSELTLSCGDEKALLRFI